MDVRRISETYSHSGRLGQVTLYQPESKEEQKEKVEGRAGKKTAAAKEEPLIRPRSSAGNKTNLSGALELVSITAEKLLKDDLPPLADLVHDASLINLLPGRYV
ncbi:MAG: hypothetical protein AB1641_08730 [Thermodesulfobacteriota bacterium]